MKNLLTRRLWLIIGMLLCVPAPVLGSSPVGPAPENAQEAFEWSDAVFVGEVVEVQKDQYGYDSTAIVQVDTDRIWKGKGLPSKVRVDGSGGPTYPARIFVLGRKYLFYVDYEQERNDIPRYIQRKAVPETVFHGGYLRADSWLHRVLSLDEDEAVEDIQFLKKKEHPGGD